MLKFVRSISKTTKQSLQTGDIKQQLKQSEKQHFKTLPYWTKRDKSHRLKYGQWNPTKKLNRQRIQDMKNIVEMMPHLRTVDLASMFSVSPEAVRRILKSKWIPSDEDEESIIKRMEKKRQKIRQEREELKLQRQKGQARSPVKIMAFVPPKTAPPRSSGPRTGQRSGQRSERFGKGSSGRNPQKSLDISEIID